MIVAHSAITKTKNILLTGEYKRWNGLDYWNGLLEWIAMPFDCQILMLGLTAVKTTTMKGSIAIRKAGAKCQ